MMSDYSIMNTTYSSSRSNVVKSSYCEVKKFNSHSTTCHCNLQDLTLSSSSSATIFKPKQQQQKHLQLQHLHIDQVHQHTDEQRGEEDDNRQRRELSENSNNIHNIMISSSLTTLESDTFSYTYSSELTSSTLSSIESTQYNRVIIVMTCTILILCLLSFLFPSLDSYNNYNHNGKKKRYDDSSNSIEASFYPITKEIIKGSSSGDVDDVQIDDDDDNNKKRSSRGKRGNGENIDGIPGSNNDDDNISSYKKYRTIHRFFEDLLPIEFRLGPWYKILAWRLKHQHFLLNIIFTRKRNDYDHDDSNNFNNSYDYNRE